MGLSKGDTVMGWLRVLQDPASALMNLRVVRGMVYRRDYHRLCGGGYEGMPEWETKF